jgi:hypothetical protein
MDFEARSQNFHLVRGFAEFYPHFILLGLYDGYSVGLVKFRTED